MGQKKISNLHIVTDIKQHNMAFPRGIQNSILPLKHLLTVTDLLPCKFAITRNFSTNLILNRSRPKTVGVMSWVRAERRRKYLEEKMRNEPKSEHQVLREEQIARTSPQIQFQMQTKERTPMNVDHV